MTRLLCMGAAALAVGCIALGAQAQGRASGGATGPKACSLLTRELALKANPKQALGAAGPKEVSLGANGAACEWGDLMLSVDPYTPARLEEIRKTSGKQWEVVPGVGDAAYFHNVQNAMGELFVRVGSRTFVVLITIPVGSTATAFKPNFITVANAVVPKLR
jgi:hypothetical protein